ncbi:uncharacterized protein LOC114321031 [Camellia sinensis]|uniref:uncharacterized protein LOC114321031 n=1 Tax=Camellia sinensis TaxID=4442 RepID=UPI001036E428|nr:uncharacterized protein LOC114321031 [Camellia sinensis]
MREIAYCLALPPQLSRLHDVFHVSMLCKYELDPAHVLDWTNLEVDENASYEERPMKILDTLEQVFRGKVIPLVKVFWHYHGVEDATWEREMKVREKYSNLFNDIFDYFLICEVGMKEIIVTVVKDYENGVEI